MLQNKFQIRIDKAFSGEEGIAKIKEKLLNPCCKAYSLVLIDYYMPPGMSGSHTSIEIRKILNSNNQKSYLACLSSQKEGDFTISTGLKNFDKFFSKPFSPEDFESLQSQIFPQ